MTLPSIGWHVTEATDSYCLERWFDGFTWSAPCYSDDPEHIRERARRTPAEAQPEVWSDASCACHARTLRRLRLEAQRPMPHTLRARQDERLH